MADNDSTGTAGGNHPSRTDTPDERRYAVVVNDEDQHSVWELGRDIPAGWRPTGFSGPMDDCLAHIDQVWTDMRPRSLREALDGGR